MASVEPFPTTPGLQGAVGHEAFPEGDAFPGLPESPVRDDLVE